MKKGYFVLFFLIFLVSFMIGWKVNVYAANMANWDFAQSGAVVYPDDTWMNNFINAHPNSNFYYYVYQNGTSPTTSVFAVEKPNTLSFRDNPYSGKRRIEINCTGSRYFVNPYGKSNMDVTYYQDVTPNQWTYPEALYSTLPSVTYHSWDGIQQTFSIVNPAPGTTLTALPTRVDYTATGWSTEQVTIYMDKLVDGVWKQYYFSPAWSITNTDTSTPTIGISANYFLWQNGTIRMRVVNTTTGTVITSPQWTVNVPPTSSVNFVGFQDGAYLENPPMVTVQKVNSPACDILLNSTVIKSYTAEDVTDTFVIKASYCQIGTNTLTAQDRNGNILKSVTFVLSQNANGGITPNPMENNPPTGGGSGGSYINDWTGYPELDPDAPWYDKVVWYVGFPFYELKNLCTTVFNGVGGLVQSAGQVPQLFASIFPFLPGEVSTGLSCGIIIVIILAIFKR